MREHGQGWERCLVQGKHSDTAAVLGKITLTLPLCLQTREMIAGTKGQLPLDSEAAAQLGHSATADSSEDMPPPPSVSPGAVSTATASAQGRGFPFPCRVTASPHQPVRMEKADPKDKTVALTEVSAEGPLSP